MYCVSLRLYVCSISLGSPLKIYTRKDAYLKKKDNDTGHKIHRSSVQRSDYSCNGQIPYLRSGHKSPLGGRKGDMTPRRTDCLVSCRVTWTSSPFKELNSAGLYSNVLKKIQ